MCTAFDLSLFGMYERMLFLLFAPEFSPDIKLILISSHLTYQYQQMVDKHSFQGRYISYSISAAS